MAIAIRTRYGDEAAALEAVKLALKQGLDLNRTNNKGEIALHGAAFRGADTIVAFLVSKGLPRMPRTNKG